MITYELLKSFCSDCELRPALRYAVRIEGRWWATDSKIVIAVPFDKCHPNDVRFTMDEMPKDIGAYPDILSATKINSFSPSGVLTVSQLQATLDKLPLVHKMVEVEKEINYIECPECDNGQISVCKTVYFNGYSYDADGEVECPICHGYGQMSDFDNYDPDKDDYNPETDKTYIATVQSKQMVRDLENSVIDLGGVTVKAAYIEKLLSVAKAMNVESIEYSYTSTALSCMVDGVFVYACGVWLGADKEKYNVVSLEN